MRYWIRFGMVLALGVLGACGQERGAPSENPSGEGRAQTPSQPVAETAYGPVRGGTDDGILTFKGIRYGADTATTRFAAPAEPEPWDDPRPATGYGPSCPQTPTGNPAGLFTSWAPRPDPGMSEDCLFLNVWTPSLEDPDRPVMVWFHGGGFASGSGSSRAYDGVRLAQRGDVVVVTVNHRLNVFGYLALAHYGDRFEDSAVAGVLDMVQALEWVHENIAGFGGDPDNVMIFGESGGGAKVSTLMATEVARGLFHRAVVQSGAMLRFLPPYSPDFNPIELAFAKIKALLKKAAARTVETLWDAIREAINAITPHDAAAFFKACGYDPEG